MLGPSFDAVGYADRAAVGFAAAVAFGMEILPGERRIVVSYIRHLVSFLDCLYSTVDCFVFGVDNTRSFF